MDKNYIEVVKCKDCIHSKRHVQLVLDDGKIVHPHRFCELMYPDMGFKDDDYCSNGVRCVL